MRHFYYTREQWEMAPLQCCLTERVNKLRLCAYKLKFIIIYTQGTDAPTTTLNNWGTLRHTRTSRSVARGPAAGSVSPTEQTLLLFSVSTGSYTESHPI